MRSVTCARLAESLEARSLQTPSRSLSKLTASWNPSALRSAQRHFCIVPAASRSPSRLPSSLLAGLGRPCCVSEPFWAAQRPFWIVPAASRSPRDAPRPFWIVLAASCVSKLFWAGQDPSGSPLLPLGALLGCSAAPPCRPDFLSKPRRAAWQCINT